MDFRRLAGEDDGRVRRIALESLGWGRMWRTTKRKNDRNGLLRSPSLRLGQRISFAIVALTTSEKDMSRPRTSRGRMWSEPKTEKITLELTPTARKLLALSSARAGLSEQEYVERLIRGDIPSQWRDRDA